MKIVVRESAMVIPADETPRTKLWLSNLDQMAPEIHTPTVYFYRPNGDENFFDANLMKDALSRALVAFYPLAGRLRKDQSGRFEIDCQGQGALFVEAESDRMIDDFGDFTPNAELRVLVPNVDYTQPIESYPLFITQVTYFKCGGVCVGNLTHHQAADGSSAAHIMKTWADLARGLDLTNPPFIDRTILRARDPPQPIFEHVEYKPSPPIQSSSLEAQSVAAIFKLPREQINLLKAKSKEDGNTINYNTFELLTSHIWKCMCKARGLADDEETKLYVHTNGRARFEPNVPQGYFGNVVFKTTLVEKARDIISKPIWYTARKIRDALAIRNNDYLRSTIDYLEIQPDLKALDGGLTHSGTSLDITSWTSFAIHDADFGWGRPIYMGLGFLFEGLGFLVPSPINDGSVSVVIQLQVEHMKLFGKFLYDTENVTDSPLVFSASRL